MEVTSIANGCVVTCPSTALKKPRVMVLYHFFPHYRAPVLRALARSSVYDFEFWGSLDEHEGIRPFRGDELVQINPISMKPTGRGFSISGFWSRALSSDVDAIISLGNPNIPQTWAVAAICRALGKPFLFWTHGWLKSEPRLKSAIRNIYYGLASRVLVYADRAHTIAGDSGFDVGRIRSIYNSLDWETASTLYDAISGQNSCQLREKHGLPIDRPVLICTARLTHLCRFDLLLEAMALLQTRGVHLSLALVGDGPEREALERQAQHHSLDVRFLGAIYDEQTLSELIFSSDATVSPGKVGLTAMHSLMYGTPVITHDDLDEQMPEVEAIIQGRTGRFFRRGDANDLARAIVDELALSPCRSSTRDECRKIIAARYTPAVQRTLIEAALDECIAR